MSEPEAFVETHPLTPVGPAAALFIAGVSAFEITPFEPPVQRVTVVGVNLPPPDTFGPFYNAYVATLLADGDQVGQFVLQPTPDQSVWGGTVLLTFGGTLFPIQVAVRPQQDNLRIGPVILEGPVFS